MTRPSEPTLTPLYPADDILAGWPRALDDEETAAYLARCMALEQAGLWKPTTAPQRAAPCPRHGFSRATCPGCVADLAMLAEPRP
jgi:hypothetical protein